MIERSTKEQGRSGEDLAQDYLRKQGYKIIERNYHCRYGEIDLIARDGETLVFVEVKSRRSTAFGTPEEAVGAAKQKKISIVALWYLAERNIHDTAARFDVVSILLTGRSRKIELIRDAFDLPR